ncbi:O-antigen translocase [Ichthyenterobacterium sp. W332]|uniref:O-antigen translocase n=1 Tax=Microcosmobacter mediterraneus TaxID=3075607 RepID=A0ABU2YQB0_9FLAO|nr:O-antigen translocase [Ichthyenterobacterium sp. W332]MDT0559243.1 O-antigen translocase [Ichthyenterobacterium sp. W332]
MNPFINKIKNNLLVKIASLNSLSVFLRLFTGFLTTKFLAVFVGAEGLALIGNFKNFLTPIQSISTLGFYSGVIKYVAEFKHKAFRLSKTISSITYITFLATCVVSIVCFISSDYLSKLVFLGDTNYSFVFKVLAVALPFYTAQALIMSVYNGLSKFKTVLFIAIGGQIVITILTLFMIWCYQLFGALLAMAIGEALIVFVSFLWIRKDARLLKLIKRKNVNLASLKRLSHYSVMALFTAICTPLVAILIRYYIINNEGIEAAGFWEAIRRISGYYLLFVTTLIALYVLPKLSEIKTDTGFRNEVLNFYKTIIPLFALGLVIIYFTRSLIVKILFTEDFVEVESLFLWQIIGDFIKVLAMVIAYQFLAKKMFWYYIITEAISLSLTYVLSVYFIDSLGVKGVTVAHAVSYSIYFIVILVIFRRPLFFPKDA